MILYPAIDLMEGQAVRLRQGKKEERTIYGDPVRIARRWREQGAEWLHLVDLDAAFSGSSTSLALIAEIVSAFGGKVELGGGLRSMEDIRLRMEAGVARCILGTAALEQPELVREACARWPGKIAVGIDAKKGLVAVRGWVETSQITATELALRVREAGVWQIIYTDVSRDGTLQGVNVEATARLAEETGMEITASGGVASLEDILALLQTGCAGAILGKSLYEGTLSLPEAISLCREDAR